MIGMEMMLKSMGLDPEAITKTVHTVAATAAAMKEQMDRIELQLKSISEKLDTVAIPQPNKGEEK